jgi:hypothetical protein
MAKLFLHMIAQISGNLMCNAQVLDTIKLPQPHKPGGMSLMQTLQL